MCERSYGWKAVRGDQLSDLGDEGQLRTEVIGELPTMYAVIVCIVSPPQALPLG